MCFKLYVLHKNLRSIYKPTGAFGVVLQSTYCDPKTNNEIEVAVKGLKGNNMHIIIMICM